jgi:hypothetical protein
MHLRWLRAEAVALLQQGPAPVPEHQHPSPHTHSTAGAARHLRRAQRASHHVFMWLTAITQSVAALSRMAHTTLHQHTQQFQVQRQASWATPRPATCCCAMGHLA